MMCGRVAVITGANKGIGFFVAQQLGASGLFENVVLGCRDATRGQAALQEIQHTLPKCVRASFFPLTIGDKATHMAFCKEMDKRFGKVDVLVNNAAIAFKAADPTPFEQQTTPTIDVNFRGTIDFTQQMLPLIRKGKDPRIVNVASMSGKLSQISTELQAKFASSSLTMNQLSDLVLQFEADVRNKCHLQNGWSKSNYGMSKLALIAATRVLARDESPSCISVNSVCPGYCDTDMTSHIGPRPPQEGASNVVLPAIMQSPPTGEFFANMSVSNW